MPIDYKKYHPNWKVISKSIIRDRAKNHCELCGVENGKWISRQRDGWNWFYCCKEDKSIKGWRVIKVVLTTHHIDFDISNNKPYNLIALCQRCHNRLDVPLRIKHRKKYVKR